MDIHFLRGSAVFRFLDSHDFRISNYDWHIGNFRFVNSKLSCIKRGLGALASEGSDAITGDQERANLLNRWYFTSMCTDDSATIPTFDRVAGLPVASNIETIVFTPGLVTVAIRKLKLGGASGTNGLPPRPFKKLADSIAEPLSLMLTSFMSIDKVSGVSTLGRPRRGAPSHSWDYHRLTNGCQKVGAPPRSKIQGRFNMPCCCISI